MNRFLNSGFLILFATVTSFAESPATPKVEFSPTDRIMVLAPHPDDEVIATGGIIQQALAQKLPIHVAFYTYGDNNEWAFTVYRGHPVLMPRSMQGMGMIRHDEALAADAVLGLSPTNLTFLGYPDFGTLIIWNAHWGEQPPFRSMLTRVTAVPYTNAFRCGAPYKGEEILADLKSVIRDFQPTKIFVSHPGDHNPDHRSLYLFTRVALWDLEKEFQPELIPYLVHYKKWPQPQGYHPEVTLVPPALFTNSVAWENFFLASTNVAIKHDAIRKHESQYRVSAAYLDSFIRPNELYGDFPIRPLRQADTNHPALVENEGEQDDVPELLTDEERGSYIGIETRSMYLEGDKVVLAMDLSRPLAREVQFSASFFGYRSDKPFGEMPKIRVNVGMLSMNILDQTNLLPADSCEITREAKKIIIKIPLALLGSPQKLLTSARTKLGEIPMDWTSWRILEIQPSAAE